MHGVAKIISLGCVKNLSDSQGIAGGLLKKGWRLADGNGSTDAVIINTCSFIKQAREESHRVIAAAIKQAKDQQGGCQVIVTGCWAQDSADQLVRVFPEVKAFVGTGSLDRVPDVLESPKHSMIVKGKPGGWLSWDERKNMMPFQGTCYLRISEGCSSGCSFCTIPRVRGPYQSRPFGDIRREVCAYANAGIREVNIIGQNTTAYGSDGRSGHDFKSILALLLEQESFKFIRILYAHPADINDRLISCIQHEPRICRYLDLPLQHISSSMLKKMGRPFDEVYTRQLVERIVEHVPGISLRTTFITGFPGETDSDFNTLLRFVENGYFAHVGVFTYSHEKGTRSYTMKKQIPEKVKNERRDMVMQAQQKIVRKKSKMRVGNIEEVMIVRTDGIYAAGRTQHEAPDVDGLIFFGSDTIKSKKPGDFCRVKITGFEGYDYYGDMV